MLAYAWPPAAYHLKRMSISGGVKHLRSPLVGASVWLCSATLGHSIACVRGGESVHMCAFVSASRAIIGSSSFGPFSRAFKRHSRRDCLSYVDVLRHCVPTLERPLWHIGETMLALGRLCVPQPMVAQLRFLPGIGYPCALSPHRPMSIWRFACLCGTSWPSVRVNTTSCAA